MPLIVVLLCFSVQGDKRYCFVPAKNKIIISMDKDLIRDVEDYFDLPVFSVR